MLFVCFMIHPPPSSPLFPYTTLFRSIQLPTVPGLSRPTILPPSQRFAGVFYDVHPVVGVEGRIGLTDRIELVPGVRLTRSEEHTSELQSRLHLVCRLLVEKKK